MNISVVGYICVTCEKKPNTNALSGFCHSSKALLGNRKVVLIFIPPMLSTSYAFFFPAHGHLFSLSSAVHR